jgi:hypothetical protein
MPLEWKPPRKARPRDQWGQFRSQADIRQEQNQARFESLQVAAEELYWQEQDRLDWEREEADQ